MFYKVDAGKKNATEQIGTKCRTGVGGCVLYSAGSKDSPGSKQRNDNIVAYSLEKKYYQYNEEWQLEGFKRHGISQAVRERIL